MVDVDFEIRGKNRAEAKARAKEVRRRLEALYVYDAKRNDETFIDRLEAYKTEIAEAMMLPEGTMKKIRVKHAETN